MARFLESRLVLTGCFLRVRSMRLRNCTTRAKVLRGRVTSTVAVEVPNLETSELPQFVLWKSALAACVRMASRGFALVAGMLTCTDDSLSAADVNSASCSA